MDKVKIIFTTLALLIMSMNANSAIIDQSNLPINAGFNSANSEIVWQQEVIAGETGQLVGVGSCLF